MTWESFIILVYKLYIDIKSKYGNIFPAFKRPPRPATVCFVVAVLDELVLFGLPEYETATWEAAEDTEQPVWG